MSRAHQDREHAHLHVMVNRVHPETGVAWERWQDRPVIERALREQERVYGLREVPGRLHQLDGREAPDDRARDADPPRQLERQADTQTLLAVMAEERMHTNFTLPNGKRVIKG